MLMLIKELCFDTICTLYWMMKILMQALSNVHAGRRLPTPVLDHWETSRHQTKDLLWQDCA